MEPEDSLPDSHPNTGMRSISSITINYNYNTIFKDLQYRYSTTQHLRVFSYLHRACWWYQVLYLSEWGTQTIMKLLNT